MLLSARFLEKKHAQSNVGKDTKKKKQIEAKTIASFFEKQNHYRNEFQNAFVNEWNRKRDQ